MQTFLETLSKQTYGCGAHVLSKDRQSHYYPQTRVIGVVTEAPGPRDCAEAWKGLTCHSQAVLYLHFYK